MHDLLRLPLLCLLPQAADGDVGVQAGGDRLPRLHPPAPAPDAGSHEDLVSLGVTATAASGHTHAGQHASGVRLSVGRREGQSVGYWHWRGWGVAAQARAWRLRTQDMCL